MTDICARTVREFCQAYGIGRTTVYKLIREGVLQKVKVGTRTLIVEAIAREWFERLTTEKPSAQSHKISHKSDADCGEPGRTVADLDEWERFAKSVGYRTGADAGE